MENLDRIGEIKVLYANIVDNRLQVKVSINHHLYKVAHVRISQKDIMMANPEIKKDYKKRTLRKIENWLNENKSFVMKELNKQTYGFWRSKLLLEEGKRAKAKYDDTEGIITEINWHHPRIPVKLEVTSGITVANKVEYYLEELDLLWD